MKTKTMRGTILLALAVALCCAACKREPACYVAKLPSAPAYSESSYNSVRSILNQYYDPGHIDDVDISLGTIYLEDSTVTHLPLKAHGHVLGIYGYRKDFCLVSDDPIQEIGYQNYEHFTTPDVAAESASLYAHSLVFISYDTSDHAIRERLLSLNSEDTVYISGRLRLYYTFTLKHRGAYPCAEGVPGLWIDDAEDIRCRP